MTIAFIGSDSFKCTRRIAKRFEKRLAKLIENDSAITFLFTGEGFFDTWCWLFVLRLQTRNRDIKRAYVPKMLEESEEQFKNKTLMYDSRIILDTVCNTGECTESVRNEAMVEMCNVLVTYLNAKELRNSVKSAEKTAVELAIQKNKHVVNLYK